MIQAKDVYQLVTTVRVVAGCIHIATGLVADSLADSHAVVVVIVSNDLFVLRLLHKLAPGFPFVFPIGIGLEIAVAIIDQRIGTVGCQLILPLGIVAVSTGSYGIAKFICGGIGILNALGHVAAAVIFVYPGLVLIRIVHSDKLAQSISFLGIVQNYINRLYTLLW